VTLETYIVTLKHEKGTVKIKVVSLSGEHGARRQVTSAEGCPECAIMQVKKTGSKKITE
jgi:hypothetical protein